MKATAPPSTPVTNGAGQNLRIRRRVGPRFGRVPDWLLTDPGLSPLAKALYASFDAGAADTSSGALAQQMGTSTASVDRAVRQLVNVGALVPSDQPGTYSLTWRHNS